jgi:hypothetical protein
VGSVPWESLRVSFDSQLLCTEIGAFDEQADWQTRLILAQCRRTHCPVLWSSVNHAWPVSDAVANGNGNLSVRPHQLRYLPATPSGVNVAVLWPIASQAMTTLVNGFSEMKLALEDRYDCLDGTLTSRDVAVTELTSLRPGRLAGRPAGQTE